MQLELETYMPNEAEEITGVTQATVRNWRRAGYLDRPKGHARYTIADLLVMFATRLMVERGVAVKAATPFAREAARAIFQTVIYRKDAYAPALLGDKAADDLQRLEALFALGDRTAQQFGLAGIKRPDWLIIWADDNIEFLYDSDADGETADAQFFGNIKYSEEYVQGPVMMLCLPALAHMICKRLPRPAIKCSTEATA